MVYSLCTVHHKWTVLKANAAYNKFIQCSIWSKLLSIATLKLNYRYRELPTYLMLLLAIINIRNHRTCINRRTHASKWNGYAFSDTSAHVVYKNTRYKQTVWYLTATKKKTQTNMRNYIKNICKYSEKEQSLRWIKNYVWPYDPLCIILVVE